MDRIVWSIPFQIALIKKLYGRFQLMQTLDQKRALVDDGLREFFAGGDAGPFKKEMEALDHADNRRAFIDELLSYGLIEELLSDAQVEDIIINGTRPIFIHHGSKGLVAVDKRFHTEEELDLFVHKLVLFSGRSRVDKLMNIELPNLEGRVNIIDSPFGPQLTITKAKSSPISVLELIERGAMTYEVAAQLWLYLEGMSIRPANMIIAGGPGVGKTTLLNALFCFIPDTDRLVVMEDTLELNTDFFDSCSRLESGENFTLADLVKNSLRMRPERIVVGEVRGAEARDMITAANIGKYCIGTIHALTSREAIMRLQNEPMNIPRELVRLIDVFVVLKRYHVAGKVTRMVDEISETSGMEQEKVLLSQIYKYDYETNQIRAVTTSTVYRDRLAQQSGLLPKDLILELQLRTLLLKELAQRGLTTLREVTLFCRAFSRDPDAAVAGLGLNREALLGKEYLKERRQRFVH